jgi:signal transduction histidine kinase
MADDPYAARRGLRLAYLAATAAFAGVFMAWTQDLWGGAVATRAFVDLATMATALGAGTLALVRTRHLPGERRIAWTLLGLACVAWGLGNLAWSYLELWSQRGLPLADRSIPFPSLADVGYVLMLPLAAGALLVMVIGSTQATTRLRTFLDGLLISASVIFAAWVLFLRPIVAFAGGEGGLGGLLSLVYPVGDLMLLSLLVLVASRVPPAVRRTLAWLAAALLALTVADVGFWYLVANDSYSTGQWSDAGWAIGFLLIGYAAIRPIPDVPTHEAPRPGLALSALPLGPFVVSTGLAMVYQVQEGALSPFLFWNAIVVVGTLAVRQFVMVYENLQLRRETEASYARLQEAEALRTRLLHTITHDLQNPLSPIQIQLHLLEKVRLDDATRRRVDLIGRNVEQIKRLTQDLADVSKLQGGELRLLRADMDLRPVLIDVADSFQPIATQRGLRLEQDLAGALAVLGDAIRLRQIVANLVSNALKFTPSGGHVTIHGRRDGGRVLVDVTDTGRGLAPEEAARLFQPFSQVHKPNESPERGSGLGLFISRGLAQAHGGTLTVSSPGLGKGTTFRLDLPAV